MTKAEATKLKDAAWASGKARVELGAGSLDIEKGVSAWRAFSDLIDSMADEPKAAKPYNEPAFPSNDQTGQFAYSGMTLRDYFAAHALALLTAPVDGRTSPEDIAKVVGAIADAMLVERAS